MFKDLIALPSQTGRVLAKLEHGGLVVESPQIIRALNSIDRSVDRLGIALVFVALLLGGVLLYNAGNTLFGQGILGISGLVLLWIILHKPN
jgi:hypothetical protein